MAASKKSSKRTAQDLSTAAFTHGADAYGARYVKEGFGFDAQEDLEWALGWPHIKRLVGGHPADKDPVANSLKMSRHGMDFPREVAARTVRLFKFAPASVEESYQWTARAKEHIETAGPISPAEVREIVRLQLANDKNVWWLDAFPHALLLMEAFVGPVPVAEALVEALEATSPQVLAQSNGDRCRCFSVLGFLLLRAPGDASEALRSRMHAVFEHVAKTLPGGLTVRNRDAEHNDLPFRALDLVLNGKQGVLRSGANPASDEIAPRDLVFVQDDPAFVLERLRKVAQKTPWAPLARLVFLGGEEVLDLESVWWSKYAEPDKDTAQKSFVLEYGRVRSSKILPILLAMTGTSKARKEAAAWFQAHAEFARPFLQKSASSDGDEGRWAKAVLDSL